MKETTQSLTCRQCGKEFIVSTSEREFNELKGFSPASRCKECRSEKQNNLKQLICAHCGVEIEQDTPIACDACLTKAQLDFELKIKQSQRAANGAHTKVQAIESQKAELAELLRQKEQLIAEMELKFNSLSQDLEKAVQFHTGLEWLEPALNGIRERLEGLEQAQNTTNERMLQIVQRIHELFENVSLWEVTKHSLKHLGKISSPGSANFDTTQIK